MIAVLAVITAVVGFIRNTNREEIPENAIVLKADGVESYLLMADIDQSDISGTVVNGKGEEKSVEGRGVTLSKLLEGKTYEVVVITSDDEYSAEVSFDEAENACLVLKDDSVTLYVFKDANSKRNVKNVVSLELK